MSTRMRAAFGLALALSIAFGVACGGDDDGDGFGAPASSSTSVAVVGSVVSPIVSTPSPPEIRVADTAGRRIITDAAGFTLYIFADDKAGTGTSACNGACRQAWPPFTISGTTVSAPPDVTGMLATILRRDETTQVTYNGKPLYRFQLDEAPGDLKGDGFGGAWTAAQP